MKKDIFGEKEEEKDIFGEKDGEKETHCRGHCWGYGWKTTLVKRCSMAEGVSLEATAAHGGPMSEQGQP